MQQQIYLFISVELSHWGLLYNIYIYGLSFSQNNHGGCSGDLVGTFGPGIAGNE